MAPAVPVHPYEEVITAMNTTSTTAPTTKMKKIVVRKPGTVRLTSLSCYCYGCCCCLRPA